MIALMAALVRVESIAYVEPGIASIYFTLVVFITILSTETFDTKLLWEKKLIFFSKIFNSERSINNEKTLYLKKCTFGLNLL